MRYFISAGEASGDLHAGELIRELRHIDPEAQFVFLGGDAMAHASGANPLIHYREMAFMGFSEVIRNLRKVLTNLSTARAAIERERPDALILVDYPSFNLKLARHAHKLNIPIFYYISPKVWAWKTYRVKDIRRYVGRVLSILPFEDDFFRAHGYDSSSYVGNPSVEEIDRRARHIRSHPVAFGDGRPVLALVPGSRRGEIRNNLPIMAEVARRYPDYCPVVAGAPGIDSELYRQYVDCEVVSGQTFELMSASAASLVTSGTATLECALLGTPQVVCYRANGSRLSYNIFKRILKIPYVSLPNLIAGREIVHEALVHLCTPDLVARALDKVLPGGEGHREQLDGYALMRSRLGESHAAATAASLIVGDLAR